MWGGREIFASGKRQTQIPFGDDNKKDKGSPSGWTPRKAKGDVTL